MITVSLDNSDPEINDASRGVKGATERTIAGLRLLCKNSDSLFLRIHSVISALNIDHLKEIADLASDIGVTEIGGALMAPFGFVPENMRFSKEQTGQLSNKIEELCEYAKTKGVALAGCYSNVSAKIIENLEHVHKMYGGNSTQVSEKHITCMGLRGQAQVRPNGDVSVCCFTYKPILGNLNNNSFEEIWNSPQANNWRELVKRGEYIDSPCVGCDTGNPVSPVTSSFTEASTASTK